MSDQKSTTVYDIGNPSDAITMLASSDVVATIAGLLLGRGMYPIRNTDTNAQVCPFWGFGGDLETWFRETYGEELEGSSDRHSVDVEAALDSLLYGGADDRRLFESACAKMAHEDAATYREQWQDNRRTSLTNIADNGRRLAAWLRDTRAKSGKDLAETNGGAR